MLLTTISSSSSRAGSRVTTGLAACAGRRCRWTTTTTTMASTTPNADAAAAQQQQQPAVANTTNNKRYKKGSGAAPKPSRQDPEAIRTVADNRGSPFFELGLAIAAAGQGRTRVRQHVNPLRAEFAAPPPPPDWRKLFADPTLPLVVDIGCGQGRFLLLLARRMRELRAAEEAKAAGGGATNKAEDNAEEKPSPAVLLPLGDDGDAAAAAAAAPTPSTAAPAPCNYLGIEIREAMVERANRWVEMIDMQGEVAFVFANATAALPGGMLDAYPGPLAACLVQFPDPHFKKRHHKRRVLQPELARFLRDRVAPGGCVFLQSDIYAAAAAMRDAVEEWGGGRGGSFELAPQHFAKGGATFPDEGPPPAQARRMATHAGAAALDRPGLTTKKQKKADGGGGGDGGGGEKEGAGAAAAAAANKAAPTANDDDDDGGDDDDQPGPASSFVSEWSREGGWLSVNPIGVPTEREHYVTAGGGSVFRVLLRRRRDGGGGGV